MVYNVYSACRSRVRNMILKTGDTLDLNNTIVIIIVIMVKMVIMNIVRGNNIQIFKHIFEHLKSEQKKNAQYIMCLCYLLQQQCGIRRRHHNLCCLVVYRHCLRFCFVEMVWFVTMCMCNFTMCAYTTHIHSVAPYYIYNVHCTSYVHARMHIADQPFSERNMDKPHDVWCKKITTFVHLQQSFYAASVSIALQPVIMHHVHIAYPSHVCGI